MQTHSASEHRSNPIRESLDQESDGLQDLHRAWMLRMAAWQLAHDGAVGHAEEILARMDALIARLEAR